MFSHNWSEWLVLKSNEELSFETRKYNSFQHFTEVINLVERKASSYINHEPQIAMKSNEGLNARRDFETIKNLSKLANSKILGYLHFQSFRKG